MAELSQWRDLPLGGVIHPADAPRPQTGGWRTGLKPVVTLDRCVNCLLCWLYCPDSAVTLDGTTFTGFDLAYCKGCALCGAVCPTGAIEMVDEDA